MVSVPNIGSNDRLNDGKCDAAGRLWAGEMDIELEMQRCSLMLDRMATVLPSSFGNIDSVPQASLHPYQRGL